MRNEKQYFLVPGHFSSVRPSLLKQKSSLDTPFCAFRSILVPPRQYSLLYIVGGWWRWLSACLSCWTNKYRKGNAERGRGIFADRTGSASLLSPYSVLYTALLAHRWMVLWAVIDVGTRDQGQRANGWRAHWGRIKENIYHWKACTIYWYLHCLPGIIRRQASSSSSSSLNPWQSEL